MKYQIIAWTEETGSHEIESYDTPEEASQALKELEKPGSLDTYYADLKEAGGYLRLEDSEGNEF